VVAILVLAAVAFTVASRVWLRGKLAPAGADAPRIVQIPDGVGTLAIARLLREEGLIQDELAFRLGLKQWDLAGQLKAGYYRLSPAMSAEEIARCLAEGRVATEKVTVPEGFTVAQIADRVEEAGLCSAEDLLSPAVVQKVRKTSSFVKNDRLEGYLFPDTYVIEYGLAPEAIVQQMVDDFRQRVLVGMAEELEASRYSLAEVVTVASMIEREARVEKDRPLIASVIYNRLKKGMRLQIDATVIYALGEHRERLTYKDLKVDSPFNTYRRKGLPPHAICNPGEASLRAALKPAKTGYLYYVAKPDGSHVFTKTYEDHKRAIRAIRGGRG
jgi:UPF0755 protein